ncbi:MAG: hypothetical protein M1457_07420 [bacterium]|nr:hypothetical protein [bacterium]
MNRRRHRPSARRPHVSLSFDIIAFILLAGLFLPLASCRHDSSPSQTTPSPVSAARAAPAAGAPGPAAYSLQSHPFSPTLAHLFDQGRIVVLPPAAIGDPPAGASTDAYAFSAVDRYGRVYHFDARASWWMADGQVLPEPLPDGQWSAAWNPASGALEVLVTSPYAGSNSIRLLRWRAGRWFEARTNLPPMARRDACRLFQPAAARWIMAGGAADRPMSDAWSLDGAIWVAWGGPPHPAASGAAVTQNPDGQPAASAGQRPDLGQATLLLDGPTTAGVGLLERDGRLWRIDGDDAKPLGRIDMDGLRLADYLPDRGQWLFVWQGGDLGRDRIMLTPAGAALAASTRPEPLDATGTVKINEEDEGVWKGWGRLRPGPAGTEQAFHPGLDGPGEAALQIAAEYGEANFPRGKIRMIELPPSLAGLRPDGAAWAAAMGGLVVPTSDGLGINASGRGDFIPPQAGDAATSPSAPLFLIRRSARFWVFSGDMVQWVKPPFDLHPAIGYPESYQQGNQTRFFSWIYPQPGLLRYEYLERTEQKKQWISSPLLTIRSLPQIAWSGVSQTNLCDPVVWGEPAEIVVIGWSGRLGQRLDIKNPPEGLLGEAYTEVPTLGFMARIPALSPREWTVSELPVPYCMGARLIVDPVRNSLYLVGGKIAVPRNVEGRRIHFLQSNAQVWEWNGTQWNCIQPGGDDPRMKVTSNVAYDPVGHRLLTLTPRALYGFVTGDWQCLWERGKVKGEDWPDEVGLSIHPLSNMIVGSWFMPRPEFRVWLQDHWVSVQPAGELAPPPGGLPSAVSAPSAAGGVLPDKSLNLVPAMEPDAFISIDTERLAAIRMDIDRPREADRLLGAHWLNLLPVNAAPDLKSQSVLPPDVQPATPAAAATDAASSPPGAASANR